MGFSCTLKWISCPFRIMQWLSHWSRVICLATQKETHTHKGAQPCHKSNVGGRQSNEASVIMLALIPVAGEGLGAALFRLMPALCHRHVGLPSLSAFLLAVKCREADEESWKEKKKPLLVYPRRWDETTSAALKWALDRYRPSTSYPPPPFVIEGVSVTLLIVCSGCSVSAGQSSRQSADCCFGRSVKVCPPISDG